MRMCTLISRHYPLKAGGLDTCNNCATKPDNNNTTTNSNNNNVMISDNTSWEGYIMELVVVEAEATMNSQSNIRPTTTTLKLYSSLTIKLLHRLHLLESSLEQLYHLFFTQVPFLEFLFSL